MSSFDCDTTEYLHFSLTVVMPSLVSVPVCWFLCNSCEEDREAALKVINGHVWKGRELGAKVNSLTFALCAKTANFD